MKITIRNHTRFESPIQLVAAVAILSPMSVQAAAPVYFDLGGLLLYGALYLIGLIILLAVVIFSKDKLASSWLFAAYVVGPLLYVGVNITVKSIQNKQASKEVADGEQKNLNAFGAYCKARKQIIHTKVKPENDVALAVRIDKEFTGINWQFNAYPIFEHMHRNLNMCEKTGVKILEGAYDGLYSAEKRGYEPEVRRYLACTKENWTVVNEFQSRYELRLGEASRKDPVPWGSAGGRWMSASSMRIIDRTTGAVLAEDTMYFLRYETGVGGCPSGIAQLSELMTGVFGTP